MFRRTEPFAEMFESWRDFDNIFRRFMGSTLELPLPIGTRRLLPAATTAAEYLPAVECYTKEKHLVFKVELPGVDPKQVEVSVVGDRLIVKGEKKEERKVEEEELYFREIAQGRFERTFELPEGVKKEQVKATLQNGVLEIVVPAPALEAARKVPVEVLESGKKTIKAA